MERKIFNSDSSTTRFDFDKFTSNYWWIRSAPSRYGLWAGCVYHNGFVGNCVTSYGNYISPICTV